MPWRRFGIALAMVLAVAGALRGARAGWGLAEGRVFHDEGYWQRRVADVAAGPAAALAPTDLAYPTLYGYAAGLLAVAGHAAGRLGPPDGLEAIRAARWTSVLADTAAVAVVGLLGRATYGPAAGLAAAALLAVAPLAVLQVHYASVDPLLLALAACVLAASWWYQRRGGVVAALVAGVTVGLAAGTKYTGLALATAPAWALLERAWRTRAPGATLREAVAAALGVGGAAVLACPPCALQPGLLNAALLHHRLMADLGGFDGNRLAPGLGWLDHRWLYQLCATLPFGLGAPTWALAMGGVVLAAVVRSPADRLLLAGSVPYFVVMGGEQVVFPRYMLPLFPALTLLAGRAALRLPAAPVVLAAAVLWGAGDAATQVARFSWRQQDAVAQALAAHAGDAGRVVAFPSYGVYFGLGPSLDAAGFRRDPRDPGAWLDPPAPFFVLPDWYAIAIRRDRRDLRLLADLERLESGAAGYRPILRLPIPWYLQQPLDTALDPAFAVDLWQGALGFTVYARDAAPPG